MNKSIFSKPILFLIFNRPDLTRQVFEQIALIKPARLYVAADGPRSGKANDERLCAESRHIVKMINWPCDVRTLFRDQNLGCRKAVSEAVTWFLEHEEEGVILEDDCLPDPSFFLFCQEMLDRYRNHDKIMHISGDNFQCGQKRGDGDYYFSIYNHIWGWATWRRTWQSNDNKIDFQKINHFIRKNIQTTPGKNYWLAVLKKIKKNNIDTWDYYWTFRIWMKNGISILPNKNLIKNIGFNEAATHIKELPTTIPNILESMPPPYKNPDKISIDFVADKLTEKNFFQKKCLIARILKKLTTAIGLKT